MSEYIEKARLLERLTDYYNQAAMDDTKPLSMRTAADCLSIIGGAPAADVVEVVRGRWIKRQFADEPTDFCYSCSECHLTYEVDTNYCPNCGAKMDGGNNNA